VDSILSRALEGQPVLVVALVVAVVFLWRDLQKEREARVNMQRDHINATNAMTVAVERLTDAIRNGRK
jgi:uncharacterized membrane protein